MYLKELQREREAKREVFYPLVHSPVGRNGWSCASPKPGARSFFQVPHVGAEAQRLGPSSTAIPGHSRELDWKWSSRVSSQCPYGIPALQARALTR